MNKNKLWILTVVLSITLLMLTGCFQNQTNNNQINNDKKQNNIEQTNTEQTDTNQTEIDKNNTGQLDTNQTETDENNTKQEDSEQTEIKLELIKQIENLEISNIVLKKKSNSKIEFIADVKNTTTEFSESKVIEITALDENGERIATFSGLVSKLAAKEQETFVTQVLKDITMAKDFEFSIVK